MDLIIKSLKLDINLLLTSKITFYKKIIFIIKKYIVITKNYIIGFNPGKSFTKIFGEKYFYNDKFEPAFLQSVYVDHSFLSNFIKENGIIIDVGANIGQFNFFCRNYLKASKVYSFEPIKNTFEVLKKNIPDNIYNMAISSQKNITMYISKDTSLLNSAISNDNINSEKQLVSTVRLDDVEKIKNEKYIDLLKIDTEGTELDVIKTGIETSKKSKYILIEVSGDRKSSGNAIELISFLYNYIPNIKLIQFGRKYLNKDTSIGACDVLFYNDSFDKII